MITTRLSKRNWKGLIVLLLFPFISISNAISLPLTSHFSSKKAISVQTDSYWSNASLAESPQDDLDDEVDPDGLCAIIDICYPSKNYIQANQYYISSAARNHQYTYLAIRCLRI